MRKFVFGGSYASAVPLLLDTYPAAAAYSLRKLRNGYTGAAIRVRRSSDNTEQDIGFVGVDLDTASLLSFVGAVNGFVTTWYDQQGSFNVTQSTLANQPQIVASGVTILRGGKPALKFDGSNDTIRRAGLTLNSNNVSFFSVSNGDTSGGIGAIHSQHSTQTSSIRTFNDRRATPFRNLVVTNTSNVNYFADMSISRNVADIRLLSSFIDSSNNMSAFDNGATGGTATYVGSINNDGLYFGVQTVVSFLNGTISEFIGYNTNESANRTAIESNINTYYGIY
jgi:hypothetical protein